MQKVVRGSDRKDDTEFTLLISASRQMTPKSKFPAGKSTEHLQSSEWNEQKCAVKKKEKKKMAHKQGERETVFNGWSSDVNAVWHAEATRWSSSV